MEINIRIALRIRELRDAQGWSLDALAERSKVSRSNISLIERGESSPTTTVLDKLATALKVPLASLFEQSAPPAIDPSPVSRADKRSIWTDPGSGYVRHRISPNAPSLIQLVEVNFPPGQRVHYETGARETEIHQQVWILDGAMEITVGETCWHLETGDCLAIQLNCPIAFRNPTLKPARYLVALASLSLNNRRDK